MSTRSWVIVATLSWGFWAFALKKAVNEMSPLAAWVAYGCTLVLLVPVALVVGRLSGIPMRFPWQGTAWAVAAAAFVGLGVFALLSAMRGGEASQTVALTATYPVVTLVLAILFLREPFTMSRALGVVVLCAGAYLVSR
jgi:transporter family protein